MKRTKNQLRAKFFFDFVLPAGLALMTLFHDGVFAAIITIGLFYVFLDSLYKYSEGNWPDRKPND